MCRLEILIDDFYTRSYTYQVMISLQPLAMIFEVTHGKKMGNIFVANSAVLYIMANFVKKKSM